MSIESFWDVAAIFITVGGLRLVFTAMRADDATVKWLRSIMIETSDTVLIALVIILAVVRPYVLSAFYIPSQSMEPTLRKDDRILVNQFVYRLNPPQRRDIIVFVAPPAALNGGPQQDFIKRVIATPGDTVEVRRGIGVYINGEKINEPGILGPPPRDFGPAVVPPRMLFVMGDNRRNSEDSTAWTDEFGRHAPWVPYENVLGRALVTFWPIRTNDIGPDGLPHTGTRLRILR